jgi:magnesium transporter
VIRSRSLAAGLAREGIMTTGIESEQPVHSAVPPADLTVIDAAIAGRTDLRAAVQKVRPADLGRDLSRRSPAEARRLLEAADDRRGAAVLRAAHPAVAANILSHGDPAHIGRLLAFMPTEHLAAMLAPLGAAERARVESALDPKRKADIERVLACRETAVGRLTTPKIWRCDRALSVGAALDILRRDADQIEVAQNCYVVEGDRLVGVVALRDLAVTPPDTAIESVMTRDPIALKEDSDRDDAAEVVHTHDFLSLPVLDAGGRLVGAVRVDDLLDAALDKIGTGILNQGGVAGRIAAQIPYFQTRLTRVVRTRLTWLVLLFVAETATGTVLRHFEDELAKVVALSFFVPLLIGTGGNAGSQTVSTIIRALALGEVQLRDVYRVVAREVSAGILLGLLLGGIAFGRALMWGVHSDLAACVAVTILVVCIWANAVGALVPLAAQKVGIDPTVVSAPLITTLVDASGLFIYFTVAHLMIAQLHA